MHLYVAIYYFITALSSTTSYVLLAANIEDFHSLAKQFIPDKMADEIFELAKDTMGIDNKDKKEILQPEFRGDYGLGLRDTPPNFYEPEVKARTTWKPKKFSSMTTKRTTSKYELSLDDLVEKVKERLKIELSEIAANAAKQKILLQSKKKRTTHKPKNEISVITFNLSEEEDHTFPDKHPPARMTESVEDKPREKEQKRTSKKPPPTVDKRYVAERFVAKPPKHMFDRGQPVSLESKPKLNHIEPLIDRQIDRQIIDVNNNRERKKKLQPKRIRTTTQDLGIFVGVKMGGINDSYEDYVTPSKDLDYLEPIEATTRRTVTKKRNIIKETTPIQTRHKNKKILDVFSDEYETTTKDENRVLFEDETTNYNKKRKQTEERTVKKNNLGNKYFNIDNKYSKPRLNNNMAAVAPLAEVNTAQQIQPYAAQLEESIYADEPVRTTTEEPKARSESIAYNELKISKYLHTPNKNGGNKTKGVKRQRQATVIPKRDMYTLSSPNYLVKIPIIGEKYHFDEPIPEEDRVPENIKPFRIPPGIVNGKVLQ